MGIGKDLHLDVAAPVDELLDHQSIIAECTLRNAPRRGQRRAKFAGTLDADHALAAAAEGWLHEYRITDRCGGTSEHGKGLVRAPVTGENGNPSPLDQPVGAAFRAHRPDRFGRRTDEDEIRLLASAC